MMFDLIHPALTADWPMVLAAAQDTAQAAGDLPERGVMSPFLNFAVTLSIYGLCIGMALCLYRVLRGPELADRVLAADLLSLHVVGLVIVLTIYVGNLVFFDLALVVSIIGFVSTVGFSQYIYATAKRPVNTPQDQKQSHEASGDGQAVAGGAS